LIPENSAECLHCGTVLSSDHTGPCPKCGKIGKRHNRNPIEPNLTVNDSIAKEESRNLIESEPPITDSLKTGKRKIIRLVEAIGISDSVTWERRRTILQNKKIHLVVIILTLIPLIDLIISRGIRAIISVFLSLIIYAITPFAIDRIKIDRG